MHPSRSKADLVAAVESGERLRFLFFWNQNTPGATVHKGCLSQWYPSPFTAEGHTFATAEHYMMWRKAVLFDDDETASRILAAGHPHAAKDLGRRVRGFDLATWEAERFGIVAEGSTLKFASTPALREYLLGTGARVLVEASPLDRVWGIGLTEDDPHAADPARWPGENLLGFALHEARARLHRPTAASLLRRR
ncbi:MULTISPECIES: NADAR family protein [unclassified Saccharothrix]|uniref:NADAR family protein n=1 Tax=unclassified Saccharothrix TaxID=2593673 RepID=UPI00307E13E2